MKGTKMKGAVDGCKTAIDTTVTARHDKAVIQKPPKFKAPGKKSSNRYNKKSTPSPAEHSGMPIQCLIESGKFKLQLFPIDCETKNVLEQNDHNPYLELTLATNKKISSVVKHLVEKWRDSFSATALGIMLFPYNARSDNLVGVHKWTLNDTHTTAADVYNLIGTPSVFRLRYGFFSNCESASNEGLPPYLEENFHLKESVPERNLSAFCDLSGEMGSIGQNEPSFDNTGGEHQNVPSKPVPLPSWLDSISNVSFGALLSETSPYLEGGNPPSQNKNLQVLQATMTCDSFDAAIGALIARQQPTNNHMPPPKAVNQPSIWDSEETCHSFAVQKAASFARVDHAPHTNALCSKELADLQTGITAETDNAEAKNEMMPLNEESNLLAKLDISLPEPMVPFENPCSRPSGSSPDSIGFSGLLSTSLDFENSVF